MAELGARLLVVDDNKVNRLLLARSLELQGHHVALAENGRIALEMLRREPFDLLLLDIEMRDSTTSCAASNSAPRITCTNRSIRSS